MMNFSTIGGINYKEDEAYQAWMRLIEDCVLAEQAFGSNKVLRIYHEDLESNPQSVVEKCLEFIGEEFSKDCLLPLRERINSSIYNEEDDYSIEGNINSEKEYVRNAFILYKNILNSYNFKKGDIRSYRVIRRKFLEKVDYRNPNRIKDLMEWNLDLLDQLKKKECEIINLRKEIQKNYKPLILYKYGPEDIFKGRPFNVQPNGESAIWVHSENATSTSVLFLDNIKLDTYVSEDGKLVTACIPRDFYEKSGKFTLYLLDLQTNVRSNILIFEVKD